MVDLSGAVLTPHALDRMRVRGIPQETVRALLERPDSVREVRPGRVVAQGAYRRPEGDEYLLRVFVDIDRDPPEVATVYRTSKVEKYRRPP